MTAKEAIKARCADCNEKQGDCQFPECQLFGLRKSKGGCDRVKAIREYCTWCMNKASVSMCCSVTCPIYKYRKMRENSSTVAELDTQ